MMLPGLWEPRGHNPPAGALPGYMELFRGGREGVKKSRRHGAIHTIDYQPSTGYKCHGVFNIISEARNKLLWMGVETSNPNH